MGFLKWLIGDKTEEETGENDGKSLSRAAGSAASKEAKNRAAGQVEAIYDRLKETTGMPVVGFELVKEKPGLFDSKIGGEYYVPRNMKPLKNQETGEELFLLAQVNFSQIPHIESFPEQGLLQIFIAGDDDLYGCDFDEPMNQHRWGIRYLEKFPKTVEPECVHSPAWKVETSMPFDIATEYKLVGKAEVQPVTPGDYRMDKYLLTNCAGLVDEDAGGFYDLEEEVCNLLADKIHAYGCQIGGYPFFTQADPREVGDEAKMPQILLFQLDSVKDIMWGDVGVGNFFISKKDLEEKDFTKVWYNWDCY